MGRQPSEIRPLGAEHFDRVLALNQAELPAVSSLDRAALRRLVAWSQIAAGAFVDGELAGFALVLGPGVPYQSDNYRWFSTRYATFAYLDRVVVSAEHRRSGIGTVLWRHVEETFPSYTLCCEVNVEPLNEASLAFHAARGFDAIAEVPREGGAKRVAMLVRRVSPTRDDR